MHYVSRLTVAVASLWAFSAQAETGKQFDGLSVGLQTGLHRNKLDVEGAGNVSILEKENGYVLRGFAGYDWQIADALVFGGEIGVGRGGPDVEGRLGTVNFSVDSGLSFDVSGRVGFLATDRVLMYGRVGYANSKIDISVADSAVTALNINRDKRHGGFLYGAGAEIAVTDSLGMRLEYRRTNYDDFKARQFLIGGVIRF